MPKAHSRTSPKGVDVAMKVAHAIQLRIEDHTWQEVADIAGYSSKAVAYNAVKRELDKIVREPAEHMVQMELEKLRAMEKEMLPKATTKGKGQIRYSAAVLRIMERRAKLLGLDDFERRSIELAERQHQLEQGDAAMVFQAMNRVFDRLNLTDEQRALLPIVVPEELGKIVEEEPVDLGELEA